jgi:hypothetical protein
MKIKELGLFLQAPGVAARAPFKVTAIPYRSASPFVLQLPASFSSFVDHTQRSFACFFLP